MIFRYSRKRITTGISFIGLFAVAISVADIDNGSVPKEVVTKVLEVKSGDMLKLDEMNDADLIKMLSHESYAVREDASILLWKRGVSVLKKLESAVLGGHPEVVSRGNELIRYIRTGISPTSSDQVKKLVHAFQSADAREKKRILTELSRLKAYSQMLLMLADMKDRELSKELYDDYNNLAFAAAGKAIGDGDHSSAIALLNLAPKSAAVYRAMAYLHARYGTLNDEINRLAGLDIAKVDDEYEDFLHLEIQGRDELRKYGEANKKGGLISTLDLLEGDPMKVYDYYLRNTALANKTGLVVLKSLYEGKGSEFVDHAIKRQLNTLNLLGGKKSPRLVNQTFKSLCLTGGGRLTEPYLMKNFPYDYFVYLNTVERPTEALASLGIEDEKSLDQFISENTGLALEESELDSQQLAKLRGASAKSYSLRLVHVANFYWDRGLPEKAKKVLKPLLDSFEIMGFDNDWYKLIRSIAYQGMHDLAIDFTIERGDKDNIYEQVVVELYDDMPEVNYLWGSLLGREGATADSSLKDIAILMGSRRVNAKTCYLIQDELIKKAKREGVASYKELKKSLIEVSFLRQDLFKLKFYIKKLMADKISEKRLSELKVEYLRALYSNLDWNELASFLEENPSIHQYSWFWTSVYSIACRKLGDIAKSDRLLEQSKLLSLSRVNALQQIASEHQLAGYPEISKTIYERILITRSENRSYNVYSTMLSNLSSLDGAYLKKGEWGKLAAMVMANIASELYMLESQSTLVTPHMRYYTGQFYSLQFTRGMELYKKGDKAKALKMLGVAHDTYLGDGMLADHFYPAIRFTDLSEEYDEWVENSYTHLKKSINAFPRSANTHNTLAWVLSRSIRKLDEGLKLSERSLELSPHQASYLDTMAELYHAKGDRKKAIEFGEKAVKSSKYGEYNIVSGRYMIFSLSSQLERFKNEPHPKL